MKIMRSVWKAGVLSMVLSSPFMYYTLSHTSTCPISVIQRQPDSTESDNGGDSTSTDSNGDGCTDGDGGEF
jgi:hypothetical protein